MNVTSNLFFFLIPGQVGSWWNLTSLDIWHHQTENEITCVGYQNDVLLYFFHQTSYKTIHSGIYYEKF